jgi:transposase
VEDLLARLEQITGVSRHTLHVLCAEVGTDLSRFPAALHLASWALMCPGHEESAGKRHSGRTRPGNHSSKAAQVASGPCDGEHGRRIWASSIGASNADGKVERAALAVGQSILVIYSPLVTTGTPYQEKGVEFLPDAGAFPRASAPGAAWRRGWDTR